MEISPALKRFIIVCFFGVFMIFLLGSNMGGYLNKLVMPHRIVGTDLYPVNISRPFRPEAGDVMVHLHIQKTSGTTFLRNLLQLNITPPCSCWGICILAGCTCKCPSVTGYSWLYSWYTSGFVSGVHPGLSELRRFPLHQYLQTTGPLLGHETRDPLDTGPTPNATVNRYVWVTMLREPVARALSEWTHLTMQVPKAIGMFRRNGHICRDPMSKDDGHFCILPKNIDLTDSEKVEYEHKLVKGMPLETFIECHNSYQFNRQVFMLADVTQATCPPLGGYTQWKAEMRHADLRKERAKKWDKLLASAKINLRSLDFFGLASEQKLSQELFEWTFHVRFTKNFTQSDKTRTVRTKQSVSKITLAKLREVLKPEMQLYEYAKKLFHFRVKEMKRCQNERMNASS